MCLIGIQFKKEGDRTGQGEHMVCALSFLTPSQDGAVPKDETAGEHGALCPAPQEVIRETGWSQGTDHSTVAYS